MQCNLIDIPNHISPKERYFCKGKVLYKSRAFDLSHEQVEEDVGAGAGVVCVVVAITTGFNPSKLE